MSISTFEENAGNIRDQLMECCNSDNVENGLIALAAIVSDLQYKIRQISEEKPENSPATPVQQTQPEICSNSICKYCRKCHACQIFKDTIGDRSNCDYFEGRKLQAVR